MLLENLLSKDSEEAFLHLERNVNARFPLDKKYADVDEKYTPDRGDRVFPLPFVLLPVQETDYYESNPTQKIKEELLEGEDIKFSVHPEMISDYTNLEIRSLLKNNGFFEVSPTSSTRTVFTRNLDKNFMLKVNLERKLGENVRRLRRNQVEHSNKICIDFENSQFPEFLGYLPETMGAVYVCNGIETGMVVREFQARPISNEKTYLLPFFSLFYLDKMFKEDDPLLTQIIEKFSVGNEFGFFREKILKPLIDSFAYFILDRGMDVDMHAQNTLLEIDKNGTPKRIVYRDFQDLFINLDRREHLGLSTDFSRNIMERPSKNYVVNGNRIEDNRKYKQILYSFEYDYKIGRILDYFSIVLSKFPSCSEEKIIDTAKEIFKKSFGETDIFPKKAYHLRQGQDNFEREFVFVEQEAKYR